MEEKREDLRGEQQRVLLEKIVSELSHADPSFYYQSTSEIAHIIKDYIDNNPKLNVRDKELLAPMTARDIQLLLSIR